MKDDSLAIVARNLTKRFGDFTAVDGIGFEIRTGEIFGFLGPNGSGKTTTIRMTLGLLQPTEGSVEVLGIPVSEHPEAIRPRVGYMSQRFSLYNDLTVIQNLRFYGRAYGLDNDQLRVAMDRALDMAGLKGREHNRTSELSGGWRQRLALSTAILHRPELVFLDEPTAGVDPVSRRAFWDLLYQLIAEGVTVFVTTHYMDEAEHCHRLAFIQHGHIIAMGSPSQIKQDTLSGQVLEFSPSDAVNAVKILRERQESGALPLHQVELFGSVVRLVTPGGTRQRRPIEKALESAGIQPGPISVIEPSLEDVFIANMRQASAQPSSSLEPHQTVHRRSS
jgi:ABC-2 type transport system ATP-binding protein